MRGLRIALAVLAAAALVAVVAVVAVASPSTARLRAAAAEYCQPSEKQDRADTAAAYAMQLRLLKSGRTKYFKKHKSAKQRKAYDLSIAKLQLKLAKAKASLADCH